MMANTIAARKREPGESVMVSSATGSAAFLLHAYSKPKNLRRSDSVLALSPALAAEHGLPEAKAEAETTARLMDRALPV